VADITQTFKSRAAVIADQAHNPRGALGEGADFMRGLDENERQRELSFLAKWAVG
jgi:GINS complex subunit 3